jgi:alanine dehydrogenase
MKIGTVREVKTHEYRIGLTPDCVNTYTNNGHEVYVQSGAGEPAGFDDSEYLDSGGKIADTAEEIFRKCDMIIKVKEPQPSEYELIREGQILYTYLHLAANRELTEFLIQRKVTGVAYETIETEKKQLPCLKPMSEIAGRLSVQEGAKYLEKPFGGRGILLGGVPGVDRGKVVIIGGGVVGRNACKIAVGFGAEVTVLDIDAERLEYLDDIYGGSITTLYSNRANIQKVIKDADLIIGAVLIHGAPTPKLLRREDLSYMKKGAVVVDVAVDQGGCIETAKPTTHDDPIYVIDGVVHYCVANMPGAVAFSSTRALVSTTLPYGLMIANKGIEEACRSSSAVLKGLNTYNGFCTYPDVAETFGLEYHKTEDVI